MTKENQKQSKKARRHINLFIKLMTNWALATTAYQEHITREDKRAIRDIIDTLKIVTEGGYLK